MHYHYKWDDVKKELGIVDAPLLEIPAFDWKWDVPIWAVLKFAELRKSTPSMYMVGWKATPKGGKLTTYDYHYGVVTNQYYK
jgi:hypothetical protein